MQRGDVDQSQGSNQLPPGNGRHRRCFGRNGRRIYMVHTALKHDANGIHRRSVEQCPLLWPRLGWESPEGSIYWRNIKRDSTWHVIVLRLEKESYHSRPCRSGNVFEKIAALAEDHRELLCCMQAEQAVGKQEQPKRGAKEDNSRPCQKGSA